MQSLVALSILGGALCIPACTGKTYDVYSPDEQRADVGAIARGDARLPVPVGTLVPDANGVARPLTPTMQGIRLQYVELGVDGTCDSEVNGEGEFYFDLGINGRTTVRRPNDDWYSARQGESIPVDAQRVFFVEPDETFALHMSASEEDNGLNFQDDRVGSATRIHSAADVRRGAVWLGAELGSGDCALNVTYVLERVQ